MVLQFTLCQAVVANAELDKITQKVEFCLFPTN